MVCLDNQIVHVWDEVPGDVAQESEVPHPRDCSPSFIPTCCVNGQQNRIGERICQQVGASNPFCIYLLPVSKYPEARPWQNMVSHIHHFSDVRSLVVDKVTSLLYINCC